MHSLQFITQLERDAKVIQALRQIRRSLALYDGAYAQLPQVEAPILLDLRPEMRALEAVLGLLGGDAEPV